MMLRETLAFGTVLAAARQRPGVDERRCRLLLDFLCTASTVRACLQRELAAAGLSEVKLRALVALFALDPTPVTPGDLAAHAGTTRSAITGIVHELQQRGIVRRSRDPHDRRGWRIALTSAGRDTADAALNGFLATLARIARPLPAAGRHALPEFCRQLEAGCQRLPSVD
jgi:DNA-binding MarR family transcriptional regulator